MARLEIDDADADIDGQAGHEGAAEAASGPATRLAIWQRPIGVAAAILLALAGGGLAVWILTRPAPDAVARFVLPTPPDGALITLTNDSSVAISPDGTRIVYATGSAEHSTRQLFMRHVDELDAAPLRGTERGNAPFFSPDGQSVGFEIGTSLHRVSVLGGPATRIADGQIVRGASWGPDDVIVFGGANGLMRVPAAGGEPEPLTQPDPEQGEIAHRWPDVLPNGKGVLFTVWSGSYEESRLAVASLETGANHVPAHRGQLPSLRPDGAHRLRCRGLVVGAGIRSRSDGAHARQPDTGGGERVHALARRRELQRVAERIAPLRVRY